jgi:hypothetical protein
MKGHAVRGKMLWFNEVTDHGFVMTDEGERLRVLGSGFVGGIRPVGRCAHTIVMFDVDDTGGARQAVNVFFEPTVAARRPRLRNGLRVRN